MKLKQLLAAALLLCSAGAWAQTDVTSTYLTNADFSATTPVTGTYLYGYGKDGAPYGFQTVDGWTSVVTKGASDGGFANSGMAGGVFSYGSSTALKGNNKTAPATNPDGEATGKCFGFFGVWGCGGYYYQEVTLAAGKYTLTFPVYNQSGTQANTTYTGFFPTSGTNQTVAVNTTVGSWVNQTVTFTLTAETEGQIRIGYQSTGNGSGANPHLFFDGVKIEWTDPDAAAHAAALDAAKYILNGYIKKATALNGVLSNSTLATAIETAQGVYDAANDWAEDYENTVSASAPLQSAITDALSGATAVSLTNGNFDEYNIAKDGTNSASFIEPATTAKPYIYPVNGWTQNFTFKSTASQGNTAAYGASISGDKGNNGTNPPSTDMFGNDEGGTLHLSSGWGDQARYKQEIASLPSGRYIFYYEANNQNNSANTINSNYFGISGNAGDFYGSTNTFIYSEAKDFNYNEWVANAFEFDLAKETSVTFHVGVIGTTGGSASAAKLWIDNVLVYRIGDVIVTDEDASKILEDVAALDEVAFNATDKSALAAAKSTFENSKTLDNYNALNTALVAAQASVTVYTALNAAITNIEGWTSDATTVTAPIRAKYTAGEYSNETVADDIYAEYQAAEIAALAAASATDYTSAIINPSFETGDMTGWSAESRTDTKVWPNSNGTYTTSGVDGDYLFNSWGGTAENNVYQTIKNLPAGTYTLSALLAGFNGESLVLAANATTNSVTVAGDKTTGYTVNVVFTLADAADVVIKASNTKSQDGSDASFIKADNFRLTAGDITTDDYTDLIAAIEAAETKTIGFDEGEYAPYNNVAALAALKAAKAVDQNVAMSQTDLDAIVNALTSATWTVNAAEVNAFYDGNFAIQPENTTGPTALKGWNNPQGIRQLIKNTETYPGLTSATGQAAVFAWGNTTMFYGETEGYTLPLKAHTMYEFSFKTCGWIDGDMGYVNVDIKNESNEGLQTVATVTATKRINESEPWDEFKVIFETGEAGNYKFGMWTSKHTTFTDLVLKKAVAVPVTIDETADYTPAETFANVTLKRSFKLGQWNTFVVPFDIPELVLKDAFGADAEIAEYSENSEDANNVTVNFNKMETPVIKANTPVLVKPTDENLKDGEIVFNAFMIKTGEAKVEGKNFDFVGTYAASTTVAEGDYFISGDKLYKSAGATKVKGTRAYLKAKTAAGGEVKLFIDGLETAISEINGDAAEQGAIYNLAGQRVEKAQKGIYIVNGKKVLVK